MKTLINSPINSSLLLSQLLTFPNSIIGKQSLKLHKIALAGVVQRIDSWPANQRVVGSIPSQRTCLGCGLGPQKGARERQPLIDVSLPLLLSPLPSL